MNPYKVLQVDKDAEQEVIDAAYRRLALKYHPDKDPSPTATEHMQRINAAYELLREPSRRREYDRRRARERAERQRREALPSEPQAPAPVSPATAAYPVEEISNRLFWKLVWAAAIVALLVYLPWVAAAIAGVWALIWFIRKFPAAAVKIGTTAVALVVAVVVYNWRSETERKERVAAELAQLDVSQTFRREEQAFEESCVAKASRKAPDVATAYCSCVTAQLRRDFDFSPIEATSVYDWDQDFRRRFQAATPDLTAQQACNRKVQPAQPMWPLVPTSQASKPVRARDVAATVPTELADPYKPRPQPTSRDLDPAVRDALSPSARERLKSPN